MDCNNCYYIQGDSEIIYIVVLPEINQREALTKGSLHWTNDKSYFWMTWMTYGSHGGISKFYTVPGCHSAVQTLNAITLTAWVSRDYPDTKASYLLICIFAPRQYISKKLKIMQNFESLWDWISWVSYSDGPRRCVQKVYLGRRAAFWTPLLVGIWWCFVLVWSSSRQLSRG